jgi:hypothetical protein
MARTRLHTRIATSAVVLGVVVAGPALAAPVLDAPSAGAVGDPLVVRASGGLTPGLSYRATFTQSAGDRRPGRQCARTIDRPYRAGTSPARVYVFRGRIPRTLACTQGGRRFLVAVRAGRYVIVVGHKTGRASWDPDAVTLRHAIQVRRG